MAALLCEQDAMGFWSKIAGLAARRPDGRPVLLGAAQRPARVAG